MFAVIKSGGKQCRVSANDIVTVEKIIAEDGDSFRFDTVLAVGDGSSISIGTPCVKGAYVQAEIVKQIRTKKVVVFKKHRRQNYRRTRGHRQEMTVVRITDIVSS
ncbi:50S ribosomal protein L21 [Candidatus Liberibacter americanus]|uniref:Large ribosomal subunit protein bL21 n=1 Tax=Candidatus Liberibacter americanus str. Sao Paulo TaxID=1261131 RepID=U6B3A3_9HYPH|nr:50S ribosomal protein L21 [Candidatus Liberibacter americanus]AHA27400.1 Ribosomal protein L21 [Candidatus Liberibacter americanus str. Sao Paulo]EMS36673.1 50S ribosomal protein L21 [Candidatus Liberibacter americanus PW_SP]